MSIGGRENALGKPTKKTEQFGGILAGRRGVGSNRPSGQINYRTLQEKLEGPKSVRRAKVESLLGNDLDTLPR